MVRIVYGLKRIQVGKVRTELLTPPYATNIFNLKTYMLHFIEVAYKKVLVGIKSCSILLRFF